MDNWKVVYVTVDRYRAEMIRQMLESNGIGAVIMDKKFSAYPHIGDIEVMVEEDNGDSAEKLIKELRP